MKAWITKAPGPVENRPLALAEIPTPTPKNKEVLIRVSACGICRTDLHVVEGDLPVRLQHVVPGHQVLGRIAAFGKDVSGYAVDERVGVAWLHRTCGVCAFCVSRRENLCDRPDFTGWTVNGGYAEYVAAPADFVYRLPQSFSDIQAAPLLCAGIIGYRALRLTELDARLEGWMGARLGIYGFGAAGHICIQLARSRGAKVYVATRDRDRHQALALELGASWVGGPTEPPPVKLDAAIIFAPAGELVPVALKALDKGGTLVLGGIHMSEIPSFEYSLIYGERGIRSVANNTRDDGRGFLAEAANIPVKTNVQVFPFEQTIDALIALKHDGIKGAGVIEVGKVKRS
jgi:propanol-preferring alcohol dehydrogenase